MNVWYVRSSDMGLTNVDIGQSVALAGYAAAWVNPNMDNNVSKEMIELRRITMWIEAAAVGADPDTLPDPTRWDQDVMNEYMAALGVASGFSESDDRQLCWEGLPAGEMYRVTGIRHGIIGALGRFAWQDPDGWQAHVAGNISPDRICETEKRPTPDLGLVAWWPPGDVDIGMNGHNWAAGDGTFITETQPRRYREDKLTEAEEVLEREAQSHQEQMARPAIVKSGWGA